MFFSNYYKFLLTGLAMF